MDSVRAELARQALRDRAQAVLGGGEGGKAIAAAYAGGGAGENDGTPAPWHHHTRRFPACEKARKTGHFPDFVKHPRGGFANAELYIRTDVEDDNADRSDLSFDFVKQRGGFGFFARVRSKGVRDPACLANFLCEGFSLIEITSAACDANRMTVGGEGFGNRAADTVTSADDQTHILAHCVCPCRCTADKVQFLNQVKRWSKIMRWDDLESEPCSVARTLSVIGDRWTLLILRDCFLGVRRFDDFRERLGLSKAILSDRLARLVEAEVLARVVYQNNPTRHEYRLTPPGLDLYPVLLAIAHWGDTHLAGKMGAPVIHTHRTCGHDFEPVTTCSHCGDEVSARQVSVRAGKGFKSPKSTP